MLKFCVGSNSETKVKLAAETLNVWATMGNWSFDLSGNGSKRWIERENKKAPVLRYHEAKLSLIMLTLTVVSVLNPKKAKKSP